MRISFREFMIELDTEGILEITSYELTEGLNEHSLLKLECLLDEDCREKAVSYTSQDSVVSVWEGDSLIFFGCLYFAETRLKKGKWELSLQYISTTYELDIKKRSRVFYRQGELYRDIIQKIADLYPETQIRDEASGGKASPGPLLQYEETDWEFLKRLASHFSAFLIPDTLSEEKRFYFGIPDIQNGQEIWDWDYEIIQDADRYNRFGQGMKQEYTVWRVISPLRLRMGEKVRFNGTDSVVTNIHIFSRKGEILREYTFSRPSGLVMRPSYNYEILGISLPVTIIARKGNLVQVEFDVNQPYPSEQPSVFFTYGIESSSFYCMPEIGSRAHVYFPNRQEWKAIAVHALNLDGGTGRNPDNKTFSAPTGAAMQLSPSAYYFQSDSGGASTLHMGTDGNVTLTGKNISLSAGTSITVGKGKESTPKVFLQSKGDQLYKAGSSSVALEANLVIIADKAKLMEESGDMSAQAQADEEALTANDG